MTLAEEIEMHVRHGVDLLFIVGLLAMARSPELHAQLDVALASVKAKIAAEQERSIRVENRPSRKAVLRRSGTRG